MIGAGVGEKESEGEQLAYIDEIQNDHGNDVEDILARSFYASAIFSGCNIRMVDGKMKCSKTYQNELKTCQNECDHCSEKESANEMP